MTFLHINIIGLCAYGRYNLSSYLSKKESMRICSTLFEEMNRTESASFSPHFVKAFIQTVIKCFTGRETV